MKFIVCLIVSLMALAKFGKTVTLERHSPPGKRLYQSLPGTERLDFLAFALGDGYTKDDTKTKLQRVGFDFPFPDALGIDDNLLEKFKTLEVPQNFTTNLYGWIRSHYNLDQPKMRTLILRRTVCLSNGECININDIGALCCPF